VFVRGLLASGAVAEIDVPGSAVVGQYGWSVQQVAARASGRYAQRADLSPYRLQLH
jgi:hypothetical protein